MVVKNQKLAPADLYAGLKQKSQTFARNFRNVCAAAKKQGYKRGREIALAGFIWWA